ncbi:MAG: SMC-Scp complex subunit ScpB [Candidatus Pacebacteria bacterium]|nr:SMC-Scp complex subunit ScpB [Candidatus Paceibacterota bacterium]
MSLEQQIEGVLFYKTEPMKIKTLAAFFEEQEETVREALTALETRLQAGATRLVRTDTEVQLTTAPELSDLIEGLRKDELSKTIGKAGAETLAIILYRGPVARAEIDKIRGVNSSFILRNLLIRGLIERVNVKGKLTFQYTVTPTLLGHLGIAKKEELPQYEDILNALDAFEASQKESEDAEKAPQ